MGDTATNGRSASPDTPDNQAIVRVGTCAWSDHEEFYPPGLKPSDRITYYAQRFPVVEVNSSYYHILPPRNYAGWATKTPPDFVFNVKAYGQLTQHHREEPPTREAFAAFRESYRPLVDAGKLRAVLFQFPPWFTDEPKSRAYLRRVAEEMAGDQVVVEFRHTSWLSPSGYRRPSASSPSSVSATSSPTRPRSAPAPPPSCRP